MSALQLAVLAKQVRAQSAAVMHSDPVAIVGLACRVPGAETADAFWDLLANGVDATRELPRSRWNANAWRERADGADIIAGRAGLLDAIDRFDAPYFDILPREAERMDPQQRLLLEVAIEALDDAGVTTHAMRGSRTGVFIASYHNDYSHLQYRDVGAIDARTLTGTLHSVVANRLSHALDLRGPSLSIDTACSSSLVAVHLACQSLRSGESDCAVAGGVSLIIAPELMVAMSKIGFMSPDGRSKTFDAAADGFGRGEGCGVVVLKRLADAVADGDRVLAVIRGSAVNQDGHSTLLTAPNGLAQQAMVREALANAQMEPERIGFVETHGTGTALGDPIEVEALAETVGRATPGAAPCLLGAAKANLGHLEAAAGVVGLIKAVLVLRHGVVPPQPHYRALNPHISLEGTRLAVPLALTPWPRGAQPRCAATSSFGVGGTNAHVILEEAPDLPAPHADARAGRILPLSARTPDALRATAERWVPFLAATDAGAADVAFTASTRRTRHSHRIAVVGASANEWRSALETYLREGSAPGGVSGVATSRRIAFVFSGQGAQWLGMGRELLAHDRVFQDAFNACDATFRALADWSLHEALEEPAERSRLDDTEVAQPVLVAMQVALAALWASWGIVPDAVAGHSVGEIAALHVAGVLALPDAMRVAWERGRIMQAATGHGRMASVNLSEHEALEVVQPFGARLAVAAINAPRSVVLSGEAEALAEALGALQTRGVTHVMLPVRYAFHCAQMDPMSARLAATLEGVHTSPPRVPVYSTVTGGLAAGERFDAAYFGRNVREPVRLANAVAAMLADGVDTFVEIAPHPVLRASLEACAADAARDVIVVGSLRRNRPERATMLEACARLHCAGLTPAWDAVQGAGRVVSLPAYPWQRERYWLRTPPDASPADVRPVIHPLLGRRVALADRTVVAFEIDAAMAPQWLSEHVIFGRTMVPAAAVLEAFAIAARTAFDGREATLTDFAMHRPLVLAEREADASRWQVVVVMHDGDASVSLYESMVGDSATREWTRVAVANASPRDGSNPLPQVEASPIRPVDPAEHYERLERSGVVFGPLFRSVRSGTTDGGSASVVVALPDGAATSEHTVHPALLDAALQACVIAARGDQSGTAEAPVMLPVSAERVEIWGTEASSLRARARVRPDTAAGAVVADVVLESLDGRSVAAMIGARFVAASPATFMAATTDELLHGLTWETAEPPATRGASIEGEWLVFADAAGVGDALAERLARRAARCAVLRAGGAFAEHGGFRWTVDPSDPAQLARVVAAAGWSSAKPLRGVVHLWNVDAPPADHAPDDMDAADRAGLGSLVQLAHVLSSIPIAPTCELWVTTRGAHVARGGEPFAALRPSAAGAWALADVIAMEHPELRVHCVDVDPVETHAPDAAASILREMETRDHHVALRGGERLVRRVVRRRTRLDETLGARRLVVVRPGVLDGVAWREAHRVQPAAGEVRLEVRASALNFRDVLVSLGAYPGEPVPLGVDCAGIVRDIGAGVTTLSPGDRVFGYAPGSLATEVTVPAAFLARTPSGLDDATAAALPVAFLTASYGLQRLARMRPGDRVLIHAAAGGVGLAAVQLALRAGATVYATAGSPEKRAMLRELGIAQVMDSRTLAFADEILRATDGAGVDVVLNSLAGEFAAASLRALARGGRFLELGKRDVMPPDAVMAARPDVQYHVYDLGALARADHELLGPMLAEIVQSMSDGTLHPLPTRVFDASTVHDALRVMAQGKHIGKLVITPPVVAGGIPVSAAGTYWITGGTGALGLETARWLVRHGARSLVLSARHAASPDAAAAIAALERSGVTVRVARADAGDPVAMRRVFDDIARSLPPLRGVVHAAGIVRDGLMAHQSWDACAEVLRGKAHGAWILRELTRDTPLDFFLLYSAAGAVLGAPGQGVYPAANAQLDALAGALRRSGCPATSVAWGLWDGTGMAGDVRARDAWAGRGLAPIVAAEAFDALERLLASGDTNGVIARIDWQHFAARLPRGMDGGAFAHVVPAGAATAGNAARQPAGGLAGAVRSLPESERRAAILAELRRCALRVLGAPQTATLDASTPLRDAGLDSLMAIEMRNVLTRAAGRPLPATLLFDYPTLDALTDHLGRTLDLLPRAEAQVSGPPGAGRTASDDLAALSDAEAERLLLAELDSAGRAAS